MAFNFQAIEKKWQKEWEKKKIFVVSEKKGKKKFYVLDMFAYPSGTGLHMGHAFAYSIGDIYTRFMRMLGFNVLYPVGYDSLGLPAENAAIKVGIHPKKYTDKAISNFIKQQKALGLSYDWSRIISSHDPSYYKWDQWIFLQMFKKGIAYRKKAPVNYCPRCKTVLANEQVQDGKCWRHKDTEVEIKHLEQWFFRITDYASKLYDSIDKLEGWHEKVKTMQKNWIGKSHGTEIDFIIDGKKWPIFTTRPDTIFGVTFMVISAQHPELPKLVKGTKQEKEVMTFISKLRGIKQEDIDKMDKEGVFIGKYAVNPINNEKVPVYVGNFVLAEYGSGMVMAVPAHDQRDFEFAKKYKIPIRVVIQPKKSKKLDEKTMKQAFIDYGTLVNSGKFNGLSSEKSIKEISKFLEQKKKGKLTIQYKLKDWLISRQRYWGTPIPIVYCEKCGIVPVPEKDLPIILPEKVKFGKGNPLETNKSFVNTTCPKCKGKAKRETDTMDTFVNSSWYFLRYCDPKNKSKIFDKKKVKYWMPIDQYIGGAEYASSHLLYFRFYTLFLQSLGLLDFSEPAINLFNQGLVLGSDGVKMSKSRGNVVDPLDTVKKFGADSLRLYLISNASPDKGFQWDDKGVEGSLRFINRVMDYFIKLKFEKSDLRVESKVNKTIKEVTQDIKEFRYNLAVIKIRKLFDYFSTNQIDKKSAGSFLKLLHIFCPHITEELWHQWNKTFISLESWPKHEEKKINLKFEKEEEIQEKLKQDIRQIIKITGTKPKAIYIYVIPKELSVYELTKQSIKKEFGCDVKFQATNKITHDPKKKAKKAKPGKPAIYIE